MLFDVLTKQLGLFTLAWRLRMSKKGVWCQLLLARLHLGEDLASMQKDIYFSFLTQLIFTL